MTQLVQHKSRQNNYQLNWEAASADAWSFTAKDDGEIYADANINIASYTLNGAVQSLPFSIVKDNQYSIIPTKITSGLVASLILNTRKSIDSSASYNVPNFSGHNGRFIYQLEGNTTVKLIDNALFSTANYVGAGVFTTSPVVATITLPTLPSTAKWQIGEFVILGGVEYFVFLGSKDDSNYSYISRIRVSDFQLTDMLGNVNAFSTINATGVARYGAIQNVIYDYINNKLYISRASGYNGSSTFLYDLNTLTYTDVIGGGAFTAQTNVANGNKLYFDPVLQRVITGNSEFSFNPLKSYVYVTSQVPGAYTQFNIYNKANGYRYRSYTTPYFNYFQIFNAYGDRIGLISNAVAAGFSAGSGQILNNEIFQYNLVAGKVVAIYDLTTNIGTSYTMLDSELPPNTVSFVDACVSDYNAEKNYFVATKQNASGTYSRLLRVFRTGSVYTNIYLDSTLIINDIGNNRLLS